MLGLGKIQLAIIIAMGLALGGAYLFIEKLRADLATSLQNQAKLESAVEVQNSTIEQLQENANRWERARQRYEETVNELSRRNALAEAQSAELRRTLSKHNLEELANRKPGLIENRVNRGTADAFRMLERITAGDIHEGSGGEETAGEAAGPGPPPD